MLVFLWRESECPGLLRLFACGANVWGLDGLIQTRLKALNTTRIVFHAPLIRVSG